MFQEVRDGVWDSWQEMEDCRQVYCTIGTQNMRRKCSRPLGGKYCTDEVTGEAVMEDLSFKTINCEAEGCPGASELILHLTFNILIFSRELR